MEAMSLSELNEFRLSTRAWLLENCPGKHAFTDADHERVEGGDKRRSANPDSYVWLERMIEKGWTVPNWPIEYGGAGLSKEQYVILLQEMAAINARPPLIGMGVVMIGPTLLSTVTTSKIFGTCRKLHGEKPAGARATANPAPVQI